MLSGADDRYGRESHVYVQMVYLLYLLRIS